MNLALILLRGSAFWVNVDCGFLQGSYSPMRPKVDGVLRNLKTYQNAARCSPES
jgi:hypothetical protein